VLGSFLLLVVAFRRFRSVWSGWRHGRRGFVIIVIAAGGQQTGQRRRAETEHNGALQQTAPVETYYTGLINQSVNPRFVAHDELLSARLPTTTKTDDVPSDP